MNRIWSFLIALGAIAATVLLLTVKDPYGVDGGGSPSEGAAPAIQAVIGGHVNSLIVPLSVGVPHANGGRLKMLGLAAPRRFAGAPDLKTFQEQGVELDAGTWVGIMAPAGTPTEILNRLNQALNTVVQMPEVRESLLKLNVEPSTMSMEQFGKFLQSEHERWGKTIREAKIRAES